MLTLASTVRASEATLRALGTGLSQLQKLDFGGDQQMLPLLDALPRHSTLRCLEIYSK